MKTWIPEESKLHGVVFLCHGYGDSIIFYAEGKLKIGAILVIVICSDELLSLNWDF